MRRGRGKYKRNERLGYNVILRRWSGKKKKWGGHVMEKTDQALRSNMEEKQPRNPKVLRTNTERMGGSLISIEMDVDTSQKSSGSVSNVSQGPNVLRRKDMHGIHLSQKTGRKARYGGIDGDTVKKGRSEQRKRYKDWKRSEDRDYRNGLQRNEDQMYVEGEVGKRQKSDTHRRSRMEMRADRRRWRSGRVPTLEWGRDLIEHGKVKYMNMETGQGEIVKWQGDEVEIGMGRQITEEVWKTRKGKVSAHMNKSENHVTAATYREVDYVTGRRVVLRYPESSEVVIPDGRQLSLPSYM